MTDFEVKKMKACLITAELNRFYKDLKQTIGHMVMKRSGLFIDRFMTMELPDLNNQRNISCICPGVYLVLPHVSPNHGECFKVYELDGSEVRGRSQILFHVGNYYTNTNGCICPGSGEKLQDLNGDRLTDVISSAAAMRRIKAIAPDGFILSI